MVVNVKEVEVMRKFSVLFLLAVFVVGITGLLAVADTVEIFDESDEINDFFSSVEKGTYDGLDLSELNAENYEKVVVVTPEGIEDGKYEIKNSESNGKVLVIVDPIHVTE